MKKELSLRLSLMGRVKLYVADWADAYANLFSLFLGEKVSTGHVMRITHAVLAFTVLVFSYGNAISAANHASVLHFGNDHQHTPCHFGILSVQFFQHPVFIGSIAFSAYLVHF